MRACIKIYWEANKSQLRTKIVAQIEQRKGKIYTFCRNREWNMQFTILSQADGLSNYNIPYCEDGNCTIDFHHCTFKLGPITAQFVYHCTPKQALGGY